MTTISELAKRGDDAIVAARAAAQDVFANTGSRDAADDAYVQVIAEYAAAAKTWRPTNLNLAELAQHLDEISRALGTLSVSPQMPHDVAPHVVALVYLSVIDYPVVGEETRTAAVDTLASALQIEHGARHARLGSWHYEAAGRVGEPSQYNGQIEVHVRTTVAGPPAVCACGIPCSHGGAQ